MVDWGRLVSGRVLHGICSYICSVSWPLSAAYFRPQKMSLEMSIHVTRVCYKLFAWLLSRSLEFDLTLSNF